MKKLWQFIQKSAFLLEFVTFSMGYNFYFFFVQKEIKPLKIINNTKMKNILSWWLYKNILSRCQLIVEIEMY